MLICGQSREFTIISRSGSFRIFDFRKYSMPAQRAGNRQFGSRYNRLFTIWYLVPYFRTRSIISFVMPFLNGCNDLDIVAAWQPQFFSSHGTYDASASCIWVTIKLNSGIENWKWFESMPSPNTQLNCNTFAIGVFGVSDRFWAFVLSRTNIFTRRRRPQHNQIY